MEEKRPHTTAQFEELNYSTKAMQPKELVQLRQLANKASAPKSPAAQFEELILLNSSHAAQRVSQLRQLVHGASEAQFEELNYSTQVMQPKSQFSSGNLAHKASAPRSPAAHL